MDHNHKHNVDHVKQHSAGYQHEQDKVSKHYGGDNHKMHHDHVQTLCNGGAAKGKK